LRVRVGRLGARARHGADDVAGRAALLELLGDADAAVEVGPRWTEVAVQRVRDAVEEGQAHAARLGRLRCRSVPRCAVESGALALPLHALAWREHNAVQAQLSEGFSETIS